MTKQKSIAGPIIKKYSDMTMIWDNNANRKKKCLRAAEQLNALPEHYIILLDSQAMCPLRDIKGNVIKPTMNTKIRQQGFQIRPIWLFDKHGYQEHFQVVQIRTQEKFNYFKLLFKDTIEYYTQTKNLYDEHN